MKHIQIEIEEADSARMERQVMEALDAIERIYAEAEKESIFLNGPFDDLTADDYLNQAAAEMQDRAASRDKDDGERSMARAVEAFNTLYGHDLTETEGWQFMSILKKSRGAGGAYREDDYVDDIAYAALAAESAQSEAA